MGPLRSKPILLALPSLAAVVAFFGLPVMTVLVESFLTNGHFVVEPPVTLDNYRYALKSDVVHYMAVNSLVIGAVVATVALAFAMPVAFWLHFHAGRLAIPVVSLVVASMFAGYLVRIYAWRTMLGTHGVVNGILWELRLVDGPLEFLIFSRTAVAIAMLHLTLPYAIVMLYAAIRPIRPEYVEVAEDLGASPMEVRRRVLTPMLAAPCMAVWFLVFVLASADFVTPQFLGGLDGQLLGTLVTRHYYDAGEFGKGAALGILMMVFYLIVFIVFHLLLRWRNIRKIEWT